MQILFNRSSALYPLGLLSLVGHLIFGYLLGGAVSLDFSMPVSPVQAVFIDIDTDSSASSLGNGKEASDAYARHIRPVRPVASTGETNHGSSGASYGRTYLPAPEIANEIETGSSPGNSILENDPVESVLNEGDHRDPASEIADRVGPATVSATFSANYNLDTGPVRSVGEFISTKKEKLTYRISLLKVPVGSAVMEAYDNDGELRITVRITSNSVLSAFYPVDDLVETRMVKGNYLLTRVRQREGDYRCDFGFALMLRERKAFWVDRLANRYDYQPIPVDDVMDAVSGFYFLRNQDLEVGRDVMLHLFDSNEYSPTKVEVLRRERITLPGSRDLDTLVLHPIFTTAGFFRRTGDIVIWLSDDQYRVPVRLETRITLGKVTAELVSAESEPALGGAEKIAAPFFLK